MDVEFSGEIWFWRGPAPWHFITVSDTARDELESVADTVSYGWGCIPVTAQIGDTTWKTSLFPRDGGYIVPVKSMVRKAEKLNLGDVVDVLLSVDI
ncbi:MAG TPA: DUF1905 domain-containing protein [Stackebrandtia sp.]|jgi:hypothetical protein|uniref:DUF1905 domain-containing protein n=1 Tax=Stackebrandtia sp. TaxID=2023065 RepID=UPI002D418AC4|nr:DUF1905 domain-containing protein [Stackebrandtia sp.]HZE38307.1 DUF1905 domain-containing protein [Stackebrandtia sp.]